MKPSSTAILFIAGMVTIALGVFFIEDGLFNNGAADYKEFSIGMAFIGIGIVCVFILFCTRPCLGRVSPWYSTSSLVIITLVYSLSLNSRWQAYPHTIEFAAGAEMVIVHVEALNEWIMIDRSLLQRTARWYESGVEITYLSADKQSSLSIQLPARYLPLKTIKKL